MSLIKKKILIAPLDWGLGHTTRCLPLIGQLLEQGCTVMLAAEGASARILQQHFPQLQILPLRGYRIRYAQSPRSFTPKLLLQIPKILYRIYQDHRWLSRQQARYGFDAVISDNRYGLYHQDCHTVIMTHQVQILSGKGSWADQILLWLHRNRLERFRECWIVDREYYGLSGILGHPHRLPDNARYIGPLSQFMCPTREQPGQTPQHILVLLSGPEPMRSQLEAILWAQCTVLTQYRFIFAAGKPGGSAPPTTPPPHMHYHDYLSGDALFQAIREAHTVICRSGYSSLMDLDLLHKKAILIPTPGQTEQEYLARYWAETGRGIWQDQSAVHIAQALEQIQKRPQEPPASIPPPASDSPSGSCPELSALLREWLHK